MKIGNWVIWKRKTILLGNQNVKEITILENKNYFSFKCFNFEKTEGEQDRFHTHAFDAISILLKGDYIEEVLDGGNIVKLNRSRKRFLFIPKNTYHRITKSNGCWTLLLTGKWGKSFKELRVSENTLVDEFLCGDKRCDLLKLRSGIKMGSIILLK